jgi:hypothetical protein
VQYWCGDGQAILRLHPRKPLPGTLYVGVTNDLSRRIGEHRSGLVAGFTKKYKVHQLVYYEEFGSISKPALASEPSNAGAANGSSS